MKKLIPIILIFILFSSAFSTKIDPYLLKQFHSQSGIHLLSQPRAKFLVWYKGNTPSGEIIKKYPFDVVEMEGTLSDIRKIANNSNVIYIFGNRPVKLFLNETINNTNSSIGDYPNIFSRYNGSRIKLEVIDEGANWSLFNTTYYTLSNNVGDHGTFVISEIISNNSPYFGIARGVTLYDGNVFSSDSTNLDQVLDGINWGLLNGVNIESMSFGSDAAGFGQRDVYLQLLYDSIFSQNNNTLFVVAAGNNGSNGSYTIAQPGSSTSMNVITVGAVDKSGTVSSFSSRGPLESNRIKPDICATGRLYGFNEKGEIVPEHGTSMSTPLVAGAAALVEQAANERDISLTPKEVKLILMEGATPRDVFSCGAGVLNVSKSISLLNSTIIEVKDNYLGYIGNSTNLTITLRNFGSKPQYINVTIRYYNGSYWNSTVLYVNKMNSTNFDLKIPDLPWNESYGFIVLNNSAHLPFSWAKAVVVSPYDFYKEKNITNKFYILNYSKLNVPTPLFVVNQSGNLISYQINDSYTYITSENKDLSGFAFEGDSFGKFKIFPVYPQQIGNGKFYNLVNESGTLYSWKFKEERTGQGEETFPSTPGKIALKIEYSSKPTILVDRKECQNETIDNVICNSNYVFSYNDSAKIALYDNSPYNVFIYSFDGNKSVDGISSFYVNDDDLYVYNGSEIVPIFSHLVSGVYPPSIISVKPMSPISITVNLTNGHSNSTLPLYIWFTTEGLFNKNQIVLLKKDVKFKDGKAKVTLNLFANKYNMIINYCLGEIETNNGEINCNGAYMQSILKFSNSGSSEKMKDYIDSTWLSHLVETISKMLYLYVNGK